MLVLIRQAIKYIDYSLSLKRKIIIFIILIFSLWISLFFISSYNNINERIIVRGRESINNSLDLAKSYLEYRMREIMNVSDNICTNENIMFNISRLYNSPDEIDLNIYYNIRNIANNLKYSYSDYKVRIYLYNSYIAKEELLYFPIELIENKIWYEKVCKKRGGAIWVANEQENYDKGISLVRSMIAPYSNNIIGILQIDFFESDYKKIIDNTLILDGMRTVLENEDSYPIYSVGNIMNDIKLTSENNEIYVDKKLEDFGWKIYSTLSHKAILASINYEARPYIIIILILFIISIYFTYVLIKNITKRVSKISEKLEYICKDNLGTLIKSQNKDEFNIIENKINEMSIHMCSLINDVYKAQVREKEAEIMALQAQISPHFLYNILDTINWMAIDQKALNISRAVTSLGKLLRLSLSKGEGIVPMKIEVEILRCFVSLQQIRFGDKLNVEFHVSREVSNGKCPKMLLQPIIENSIKHGILSQRNPNIGKIWIYIRVVGRLIFVRIEDNGQNYDITSKKSICHKKSYSGYGLKNISERMKLIYENNYTMKIEKNIAGNTEVTLTWPFESYQGDLI